MPGQGLLPPRRGCAGLETSIRHRPAVRRAAAVAPSTSNLDPPGPAVDGRTRHLIQPVNRNRPGSVLGHKDGSSWPAGGPTAACQPHFRVQTCRADRRRIAVRRIAKAALTLAATVTMVAADRKSTRLNSSHLGI